MNLITNIKVMLKPFKSNYRRSSAQLVILLKRENIYMRRMINIADVKTIQLSAKDYNQTRYELVLDAVAPQKLIILPDKTLGAKPLLVTFKQPAIIVVDSAVTKLDGLSSGFNGNAEFSLIDGWTENSTKEIDVFIFNGFVYVDTIREM